MGYSARIVADFGTLNEQDAARLAAGAGAITARLRSTG